MPKWRVVSVRVQIATVDPVVNLFAQHCVAQPSVHIEADHDADETPQFEATWADIQGVLPQGPPGDLALTHIEVGLKLLALLVPIGEHRVTTVDESEWGEQIPEPLRVGQRLIVKSPRDKLEPPPGTIVIDLEPGMGFGTGAHPSTALLLTMLEQLPLTGKRLLDLGSGSGILTIAALRLGSAGCVAIDSDEQAVIASRKNIALANLDERAEVHRGTLPGDYAPNAAFDIVLANITSRVLRDLSPHIAATLKPGGTLLCSGIIQKHREYVVEGFTANGLRKQEELIRGEWVALRFQRD